MQSTSPTHPKTTLIMVSVLFLVALFSFTLGLKLGKTMNETKSINQESLACVQNKEAPVLQTTESQAHMTTDQANVEPAAPVNAESDATQTSALPSESTPEGVNQ